MHNRKIALFILIFVVAGSLTLGTVDVRSEAVYIVPPTSSAGGTAELKYQSVCGPGTVVTKPTCSTGDPYIFVFPVYMKGGITTSIYAMTGVTTFATDNGNGTWTVRAQVKDARDALWEDPLAIQTIVQVWCCANADCS